MAIREERRGAVTLLTIDRPKALNSINLDVIEGLEAALDRIEASDSRAFVITGEGRAFCAGGDLKETGYDMEERLARIHRLMLRLVGFPKLGIAAINGLALGGGLELALACTFRVASPVAQMGVPEVKMSQMPGYGGTQLLPRRIGESRALFMLMSGEAVDAQQALSFGLVEAVAEDCVGKAVEMAERLSGQSSLLAQQTIRRVVAEGMKLPLADALDLERELVKPLRAEGLQQAKAEQLKRKTL